MEYGSDIFLNDNINYCKVYIPVGTLEDYQFTSPWYNFLNIIEYSYTIPGDVNGDGHVSSVDVTALYNHMLNGDSSAIVNGDQDGDGIITSVDITIIYNHLLGN